jgi:quercetin dioxygenase-like cupin family protein
VGPTGPADPRHFERCRHDAAPIVDLGDGSKLKVLMVDEVHELWIVENIFSKGYVASTHVHTGPVYTYTRSGRWQYVEYDEAFEPGSFLFEPAGSTHTVSSLEDDTHVWVQIYGDVLNLDADGNVASVFDGPSVLEVYNLMCEAAGVPRPDVVVA